MRPCLIARFKPTEDIVVSMAEDSELSKVPKIPYADPQLRIGSSGYREYAYPSDRAGFWNPAPITVSGDLLRLEPGPLFVRFIGICIVSLGCISAIAFTTRSSEAHSTLTASVVRIAVWGLLIMGLLIIPGLLSARRRLLAPSVEVDRCKRFIYLPRANKRIPFADVVRLQFVSTDPRGFSPQTLSYRGERYWGELQIVFTDCAREQTWCLVGWLSKDIARRFAGLFRQQTEIPVSRIYVLVDGNWHVEPFDGS